MGLILLSIVALVYGVLRMTGVTKVSPEVEKSVHEKEYRKMSGASYIYLGIAWFIIAFVCNYFKLGSLILVILAVVLALPALLIESKAQKKYL